MCSGRGWIRSCSLSWPVGMVLELGEMIGHLDRLGQDFAGNEPVGRLLQLANELLVVDREVAILALQRDELIANLVAVLSGLLRDVLGILAVLRDPFAFGAERIVHGANQRGI